MELLSINQFKKSDDGYYQFQAIASSERLDAHGQRFDIDSLEFACKYPLLLLEHEYNKYLPVGNASDFHKHEIGGKKYASFTGMIDKSTNSDIVDMIKNEYYKAVSIGGASVTDVSKDGVIYDGRIKEISLVRIPANDDAVIFNKAAKVSADKFFGLSESEIVDILNVSFTKDMSLILLRLIMAGFDSISSWDIGMLKWLNELYNDQTKSK